MVYQAFPFTETPLNSDPLYLSWNLPWLHFSADLRATSFKFLLLDNKSYLRELNMFCRILYYFAEKSYSISGLSSFGIISGFLRIMALRSSTSWMYLQKYNSSDSGKFYCCSINSFGLFLLTTYLLTFVN